ncbi:ras-like protein family member 11B [Saccoglossus kowalevskii]
MNLHILDTAGDFDPSNSVREEQVKWADAIIFVFSVTDKLSIEYVQKLRKEIKSTRDWDKTPCALLANKCELSHFREVTPAEGCVAANHMNCQYFEVSAGESYRGITEAIHWIAKEWIKITRRMKVKRLVSRLQLKNTLRNFGFRERTNTL